MNTVSKIQKAELLSIKNDTEFFGEIVLQLSSQAQSGILIFGLIPFASLYIVESFGYIKRTFPAQVGSFSSIYERIIRNSRMRVKIFDDSKKRIGGMFELLEWINGFYAEWFINKHKGLLASIKRKLQKDLGLFGYNGHLFGSTHTGLLNIGYEEGDLPSTSKEISILLGKEVFSISQEMGSYVGQMCSLFELNVKNASAKFFDYQIQDEFLGYRDEKSFEFFLSVFNGADSEYLNFTLLYFLITVNFLQHILKFVISGSPPTFFKMKFITLYHLASSLKKLQNYFYPKNVLSERSKKYFRELLQDEELKLIGRQSDFRNALVHYEVKGLLDADIDLTLKFYGLVEHYFAGRSYESVDSILDILLERVSLILEEWLNWNIKPSQFLSW
jgi:hypothetical protein